jgi:2-polyprenyl-3-methyl-5-hydroxy-6-metoxy-1,4-benzoquinol methylase
MSKHDTQEAIRWQSEAAFFDSAAADAIKHVGLIDAKTVHRYGVLRRRRFSKEFRFRVMGDLAGKSVLDVGCGDGLNALNFAMLGASVTGIDISPGAIEVAKRRVEVNGVAASARFICSPLEIADFPSDSFDIVWGDAILHHLISDLDNVIRHMHRWAKPGGLIIFAEPMNLNPALRRLRMSLPIKTDATPDERPLEKAEIELIRQRLPDLAIRHFSLLDRLNRFVLPDHNYERASALQRLVVNILGAIDYFLLSVPFFQPLAATSVMYARKASGRECPSPS